jgi:hypothetical protein
VLDEIRHGLGGQILSNMNHASTLSLYPPVGATLKRMFPGREFASDIELINEQGRQALFSKHKV